jgi:imidazolonepropionase-like amidohydrolase
MKRFLFLAAAALVASAAPAAAQTGSLTITNARILDGRGGVIERGTIVVRDGRIASVSAGAAAAPSGRTIDARGMTVMPGFIEAHRHVIQGDAARWLQEQAPARMLEYLEAGFTTVMSCGDSATEILELRKRLQEGRVSGPRLFAAGRAPLAGAAAGGGRGGGAAVDPARSDRSRAPRPQAAPAIPADQTRATVAAIAKAGFDAIKTNIIVTPGGPETETLKLVVQEGRRYNLPTITHAVTVQDTIAAVDAGVASLVHTPHIGRLDESPDTVQKIARAGIPMMSTLGVFVPRFTGGEAPIFRDNQPFPWATVSSGGQGPVNARLLYEAGITYGYGTDTSWTPRESLIHELRPLGLMFSPKEIVSILTRNAAAAILRGADLGTLEAGKLADIVMLGGDPLANSANLLNVAVVIKGGEVMVDKRN